MSVLIKGMKMPERCGKGCPFHDIDPHDGYPSCGLSKHTGKPDSEAFHKVGVVFPDGCPLVEVPPHGRLIDADAVLDTMFKLVDEETFRAFSAVVNDAPIVIEAEGK